MEKSFCRPSGNTSSKTMTYSRSLARVVSARSSKLGIVIVANSSPSNSSATSQGTFTSVARCYARLRYCANFRAWSRTCSRQNWSILWFRPSRSSPTSSSWWSISTRICAPSSPTPWTTLRRSTSKHWCITCSAQFIFCILLTLFIVISSHPTCSSLTSVMSRFVILDWREHCHH